MTDQPPILTDTITDVLSNLNYYTIYTVASKSQELRWILANREFWWKVLDRLAESRWEREWIRTLDVDALMELTIRWQALATSQRSTIGYSPGAERYIPITELLYDVNLRGDQTMLKYLSRVCYSPIPVCQALAELGDEKCISLARENEVLTNGCLMNAAMGAIDGGWDDLLARLLGMIEIRETNVSSPLAHTAIEKKNLNAFIMISKYHPIMIDDMILRALMNGWADHLPRGTLKAITTDDFIYLDAVGLDVRDIAPSYITSMKMVDYLCEAVDPEAVWCSLVMSGGLKLLEQFDAEYTIEEIKVIYLLDDIIENSRYLSHNSREMAEYLLSTKMSPYVKAKVLAILHLIDIINVERVMEGVESPGDILAIVLQRGTSRDDIDWIMYICELVTDASKIVSAYIDDIIYTSHIEVVGALASVMDKELDDVLSTMLKDIDTGLGMSEIISYLRFIGGEEIENVYDYTDDVDICVALRGEISIQQVLNSDNAYSNRELQILLSLAIAKGEVAEITLKEYL